MEREELTADGPDDADGGVFRRLAKSNFDFSKSWPVDYNVDFDRWPPPEAALQLLREMYGNANVHPPGDDSTGYVQFQVLDHVSYEGVISVQLRTSAAMRPYGGICESWGVLH